MTIHSTHPFADSEPDPVRRLRGRQGGAVWLWTSGADRGRAGLTVTSMLIANGADAHVLALLDPDADLAEALQSGGTAVVQALRWPERDLADRFAGLTPAPGGVFAHATWEQTAWGPRLAGKRTWAGIRLVTEAAVGWSVLVTCRLESVEVAEDDEPLLHHRGRYMRGLPMEGNR